MHQMTALADMRSLRKPDKTFAVTNELHVVQVAPRLVLITSTPISRRSGTGT